MVFDQTSSIMGANQVTVSQMVAYYRSKGHLYPSEVYASKGAPTLEQFCTIAYEEAAAEGVRAEVLFSQAMQETGWLQFGGSVKPYQCNFGGLGATNASVGGAVFPDVRTGLRAQVQHLKLYASVLPLNKPLVDERWYDAVDRWGRGSAPYLEMLNGKWAVPGDGYGEGIYRKMQEMQKF